MHPRLASSFLCAEDNGEYLILLPVPPECYDLWGSHAVYRVLGTR